MLDTSDEARPNGTTPRSYTADDEAVRLRLQADSLDTVTISLVAGLMSHRIENVLQIGSESVRHYVRQQLPSARLWHADVHSKTENAHLVESYADHRLVESLKLGGTSRVGPSDLPPPAFFDLVHVRCTLSCTPDRDELLDRLCAWLAPGGTILVEEFTALPVPVSPSPVGRAIAAISELMTTALGADLKWTAELPQALKGRDLRDVGAHPQMYTINPGTPLARFWQMTLEKWEYFLLDHGRMTQAQIDLAREQLAAANLWELGMPTMSAWGTAR